ncbi:MAG: hypothetical protein ACP5E3_19940, partial [Bacteroidales bacterium]
MKKSLLSLIFLLLFLSLYSQEKLRLDHHIYEDWNEIRNPIISADGRFISYEVNPQLGDGSLVIRDLNKGVSDTIPRGYKARFSYDSKFIAGMIKVPRDSIRKAKLDKKIPEDLFRDSLFVFFPDDKELEKFPNVRSYKLSEEGMNTLVFHLDFIPENDKEKEEESDKTPEEEEIDKKFSTIVKKHKLADLVLYDPSTRSTQNFENVSSYTLSKNGELIGFHQLARDTIIFSVVYTIENPGNNLNICYESEGLVYNLSADDYGKRLAFLYSQDTLKKSGMELQYWEVGKANAEILIDTLGTGLGDDRVVNRNGRIYFSGDSSRLFFGTTKP